MRVAALDGADSPGGRHHASPLGRKGSQINRGQGLSGRRVVGMRVWALSVSCGELRAWSAGDAGSAVALLVLVRPARNRTLEVRPGLRRSRPPTGPVRVVAHHPHPEGGTAYTGQLRAHRLDPDQPEGLPTQLDRSGQDSGRREPSGRHRQVLLDAHGSDRASDPPGRSRHRRACALGRGWPWRCPRVWSSPVRRAPPRTRRLCAGPRLPAARR